MPTINVEDAGRHLCPFTAFQTCHGSKCMAWSWRGPTIERQRTNNLVETPDGLRPSDIIPPMPDGEGWQQDGGPRFVGYENSAKLKLPRALEQSWVRRLQPQRGQCGRVEPDQHYDDYLPF